MLPGNARVDAKGSRTQRAADDKLARRRLALHGSRRLLPKAAGWPFWDRDSVPRAIPPLAGGFGCRSRRLNFPELPSFLAFLFCETRGLASKGSSKGAGNLAPDQKRISHESQQTNAPVPWTPGSGSGLRSEEHTSELQSLRHL